MLKKIKKNILLIACSAMILFQGCKKEQEEAPAPSISFTYSNSKDTSPVSVSFVASIQNSSNVSWDFGDGQTGTGVSIQHIYTTQGLFKVVAKTTSEDAITASQIKYVNVSPFSKINISQVYISSPTKNPGGSTWDQTGGQTNPDLYCEVYNSSGEKISNSNVYINNVFSTYYSFSPSLSITDFEGEFTVNIMDFDLGSYLDETIATFKFRPGDYFTSALPFPGTFIKDNGTGSVAKVYAFWN